MGPGQPSFFETRKNDAITEHRIDVKTLRRQHHRPRRRRQRHKRNVRH